MSIAHVDTGTLITKIPVNSPTFSIAWHPKRYLLAYACDDKDKYGKIQNVIIQELLKVFQCQKIVIFYTRILT